MKPRQLSKYTLIFLTIILSACAAPLADSPVPATSTSYAAPAETSPPALTNTPVPTPDIRTAVAAAAEATVQALALTQTAEATIPPSSTPTPVLLDTDPAFEAWLGEAEILVYEDMAGNLVALRYVQEALDNLGLGYTDVGDAVGTFRDELLSEQVWDLIISASESRDIVQGEYYTYLFEHLNEGSAVIIELWNLHGISNGQIAPMLAACGIELQENWENQPLEAQHLAPLDTSHPILNYPNSNLLLNQPTGFWLYELGDLLRLTPASEAALLWGLDAGTPDRSGTVASCVDSRLIVQTFSSHNYERETMIQLWENYIYNALFARYQAGS